MILPGILVNSIHPGAVDTELTRHMLEVVSKVSATMAQMISDNIAGITWHPRHASLTQLCVAMPPMVCVNAWVMCHVPVFLNVLRVAGGMPMIMWCFNCPPPSLRQENLLCDRLISEDL